MAEAQKQKHPEQDPRKGESFVGGLIKDSIPVVGTVRAYKDAKFYCKNGDYVACGLMSGATLWAGLTDIGLTLSLVAAATGVGAPVGATGTATSTAAKKAGVSGLKALALKFGKRGLQYGTEMFAKVLNEEGLEKAIKEASKKAAEEALKGAPLAGKTAEKALETIAKGTEKKLVSEAESIYTSTFKKAYEEAVLGGKSAEAAQILAKKEASNAVKKELEAGLKDTAAEHAKALASKKVKAKTPLREAKTADLEGAGTIRKAYVKAIYSPTDAGAFMFDRMMNGVSYLLEKGSPIVSSGIDALKWTAGTTVKGGRISKTAVPIVSGAVVRNTAHGSAVVTSTGERYVKKKASGLMEGKEEAKPAPVVEGQRFDQKIDRILSNVMNGFDDTLERRRFIADIQKIRNSSKSPEEAYKKVDAMIETIPDSNLKAMLRKDVDKI